MSSGRLSLSIVSIGVIGMLVAGGLWLSKQIDHDKIASSIFSDDFQPKSIGSAAQATNAAGKRLSPKEVIFDPEALDERRAIELTIRVPFTALLKPGEPVPPALLQPLYVEARAPDYLSTRCGEWREVLVARCKLVAAGSDGGGVGTDAGDHWVSLVAVYGVVPLDLDPGPARPREHRLGSASVTFTLPDEAVHPLDRSSVFAQIRQGWADACAGLREQHGNCGLQRLEISEHPVGDGNARFTASALLLSLLAGSDS